MGKTESDQEAKQDQTKSGEAYATAANRHEIFFGHGVSEDGRHRFTIAIKPVDSTTAQVGVAVCSTRDVFTKRTGRMVAEGRARKRPTLKYVGVCTTTIEGMLNIKKKVKEDHHFVKTVLEDEKIFLIGDEGELAKLARKPTVKSP